jgi:hypothetical protein
MPPLVLDDEEAVAVAVGLCTAAGHAVAVGLCTAAGHAVAGIGRATGTSST